MKSQQGHKETNVPRPNVVREHFMPLFFLALFFSEALLFCCQTTLPGNTSVSAQVMELKTSKKIIPKIKEYLLTMTLPLLDPDTSNSLLKSRQRTLSPVGWASTSPTALIVSPSYCCISLFLWVEARTTGPGPDTPNPSQL